jgi:hypothetical protein
MRGQDPIPSGFKHPETAGREEKTPACDLASGLSDMRDAPTPKIGDIFETVERYERTGSFSVLPTGSLSASIPMALAT